MISVTDRIDYLTADEEEEYVIAGSDLNISEDNFILDKFRLVIGENRMVKSEEVDYIDISTANSICYY